MWSQSESKKLEVIVSVSVTHSQHGGGIGGSVGDLETCRNLMSYSEDCVSYLVE